MAQLKESIQRNHADAILLSGGLDSSILASLAGARYSVTCAYGNLAPDLEFSKKVASRYCKKHVQVMLDNNKLLKTIDQAIQIFKTFDPMEIRNSSVAFAAIERAKHDGFDSVMTGDGGDELFAGYNYLQRYYSDLPRLKAELERLWQVMHFSSREIGKSLGVSIITPLLDDKFSEYAKSIPVDKKVGEHLGQTWGKFILRKCFEKELGKEIVWRKKLAQEEGSSVNEIQHFIEKVIDDSNFKSESEKALKEGVKIRSKEHLYYYRIFKNHFPLPKEGDCDVRCPECSGCFKGSGRFCRICGAFPVIPVRSKL